MWPFGEGAIIVVGVVLVSPGAVSGGCCFEGSWITAVLLAP